MHLHLPTTASSESVAGYEPKKVHMAEGTIDLCRRGLPSLTSYP